MSRKSRSANGRVQHGPKPQSAARESEDDMPDSVAARVADVSARAGGNDELRQLMARRRLEQYLETKRLRQHLQEIYYDDEP